MAFKVAMEAGWKSILEGEFEQPYFHTLRDFLQQEKGKYRLYPSGKRIFAAFDLCPFEQTRVVILGQDPYHGPGQAHGLSFSVPAGVSPPPSLQNIFKELRADLGHEPPKHGNLESWARQGVLLLNSVLTVRHKSPGSHQNKGWESFTDAAIQKLSQHTRHRVFLLWGRFAQSKEALIDTDKHLVIKSAHPSPFSAHRGFLGSRPFSRANAYLQAHDEPPVNWELPREC
jgi:uracil-DNA glycosylase